MWGSTGRVPFRTWETVATETPALRATSAMVAIASPSLSRLSRLRRPSGPAAPDAVGRHTARTYGMDALRGPAEPSGLDGRGPSGRDAIPSSTPA
ncbi:hypothetical protein GCM10010260_69110 [Streptomyces filipinensis]|uniref:Uncharacterized protein n=1 Tax=Streptomyces filipinensis TaxID=66887 RepID=A0A918MF04_9ACTN|nr:hypothetical protein GCM10010260_69110 [Streptomyces filipinensis]